MEDSILKSTKRMLGIEENYTVFDLQILTHINAALSELNQIGAGDGVPIEDDKATWSDKDLPPVRLNLFRNIVFLKTSLAFDPPGTSYLIDLKKDQIEEQMHRLNTFIEGDRILPESEEVEL